MATSPTSNPKRTNEEIFHTLVHKVRVLSLEQVAATWWSHTKQPQPNARRALRALSQAGALDCSMYPARPISFAIDRPVVSWQPSWPDPDPHAISYKLQSRWTEAPRDTTVCTPTQRTIYRLGGEGGAGTEPAKLTHDLLMAAVYLFCLKRHPVIARHWVGEDNYRDERHGQKLPDALIYDDHNPPSVRLVIESGGAYNATQVEEFHRDCKERGHPYQIW